MDFSMLMQSFGEIFKPLVIGAIFLGAFSGVLLGALPGLTATMAVALLVPMSFGLPLNVSFGLLLGIFCGAMYGGSISAILIRTPGTPGAAATLLDGHPLCLKGGADRALCMALYASFTGGIISAVIMTLLSPYLSRLALKFGPTEYFGLAVFGLSIIISVSGRSVIKGLIAGVFGLLLCTIGCDPVTGYARFTFGEMQLYEGPPLVPTLIGLFAISEIFCNVESLVSGEKSSHRIKKIWPSKEDIKTCTPVAAFGGLIGTFIGILPGVGGDIGAFFSYSLVKRLSKHPEKFGTGIVEGVAATESANNGVTGGAMIPLLSLGIPGDSVTAVMLGAFIVQGLQPGPLLYKDHLPVVYMIFASMFIANFAMLVVGLVGSRFFVRIIGIKKHILVPIILILSMVGAYSMRNSVFDVFLALVMGTIGFIMRKFDIPAAPVLLAIILGPMAESNMRRALRISDGNFMTFIVHPIGAVLLGLAVLFIITSLISQIRIEKRLEEQGQKEESL
jgi:putative tricarboxylic transport membrane protein